MFRRLVLLLGALAGVDACSFWLTSYLFLLSNDPDHAVYKSYGWQSFLDYVNDLVKPRGPDYTTTKIIDGNFAMVHNLLAITSSNDV